MAASKRPTPTSKVVEMDQLLLDELNDVARIAGEPANSVARLCLRAGLAQIRAENFTIFRLNGGQIAKHIEVQNDREAHFAKRLHSDVREVAFYADDTIEAGRVTGTHVGNPPSKMPVPATWTLPVDFVVKVRGDSMSPFIEDGELAAFTKATKAQNGQVVAALVEGQMVMKMFNDAGDGEPELLSINIDYPAIPCDGEVVIQGVYQGKFPPPDVSPPAAPKRKRTPRK